MYGVARGCGCEEGWGGTAGEYGVWPRVTSETWIVHRPWKVSEVFKVETFCFSSFSSGRRGRSLSALS